MYIKKILEEALKKIFLSFSILLAKLFSGEISLEEVALNESLFYFGCARRLVMDFEDFLSETTKEISLGNKTCKLPLSRRQELINTLNKLKIIVLEAEKNNRIVWNFHSTDTSWVKLKKLLENNGIQLPIEIRYIPRDVSLPNSQRAAFYMKYNLKLPLDFSGSLHKVSQ